MTAAVYIGPPVGCTFCAYAVGAPDGAIVPIPEATVIVTTPAGDRLLCGAHARTGKPDQRTRRVSRVSP